MSSRKRYVVLTPFDNPLVIASLLLLHNVKADVASTGSGVAVIGELESKQFDDWDISELLGGETPVPEADSKEDADINQDPAEIARVFANLSNYGVVLFVAELGDDVGGEAGVSGLVTAQRFVKDRTPEELSSGLLLNSLDPKIEGFVLGLKPIDEIDPNVIHPEQAEQFVRENFSEDK